MAFEAKPGQTVKITISKQITRATARKTIERIFMTDKVLVKPLDDRSANFIPLPKRRGGCIWTKRVNKIHLGLNKGDVATVKVTPQMIRDLVSIEGFVQVSA